MMMMRVYGQRVRGLGVLTPSVPRQGACSSTAQAFGGASIHLFSGGLLNSLLSIAITTTEAWDDPPPLFLFHIHITLSPSWTSS